MTRHAAPRRGFTLVELLVVIGIIAILFSLTIVVIGKVKTKAKVATTAADIAQIANAIGTYKSKMQVQFVPSCGGGTGGLFRLRGTYAGNEPEAIYLKSVWPQLDLTKTLLPDSDLDANQTLVFFLTGGAVTEYQGFSTNRVSPFTKVPAGSTESRLGPFLTFPENRYVNNTEVPGADKRHPCLLDQFGSPFAYFAFNPVVNTYKYPVYDTKSNSYSYTGDQAFRFNSTNVSPYVLNNKYLEPKGFQIISAGDNGKDDQSTPNTYGFGPGGTNWTPGGGVYAEGMAGADDIANFNGGGLLINQN